MPNIDLENATHEELHQIKNEVMKKLIEKASVPGQLRSDGYDRHGSGHSRSGTGSSILDEVAKKAIINPATKIGTP